MRNGLQKAVWACVPAILAAAAWAGEPAAPIRADPFGKLPDGRAVTCYTLANGRGITARILDYGGIVVSLTAPDRDGRAGDVVLGYDRIEDYLQRSPYFGCICGRFANRIAKGRFTLDGKEYKLALNFGPNHLHGGAKGFDKVLWRAAPSVSTNGPALTLVYVSPDGEEGYPGNLTVRAVYTLTRDNELRLDFSAMTDAPTVLSLTQHSYFNLAGADRGEVLDHRLTLAADQLLDVDETLVPTGRKLWVHDTPFDFTKARRIGDGIAADHPLIKLGNGYDHCFVLRGSDGTLMPAARVSDPAGGRVMEVWTTMPGMVLYVANMGDGHAGKAGASYKGHAALCLEAQHFPDAPNRPEFPSTVLRPGQEYRHTIAFRFLTEN
jgi:aldose 1-epimerase